MKMKINFVLFCSLFIFSCSKESIELKQRSTGNMQVTLILQDNSSVVLTLQSVSATYQNSSQINVVTNPGGSGSQSFTVKSLSIDEPDGALKLTKSNSFGTTVYTEKHQATIVPNGGNLKLTAQNGNVITTATSIVGEEDDGF
jgi:hypothetical protein